MSGGSSCKVPVGTHFGVFGIFICSFLAGLAALLPLRPIRIEDIAGDKDGVIISTSHFHCVLARAGSRRVYFRATKIHTLDTNWEWRVRFDGAFKLILVKGNGLPATAGQYESFESASGMVYLRFPDVLLALGILGVPFPCWAFVFVGLVLLTTFLGGVGPLACICLALLGVTFAAIALLYSHYISNRTMLSNRLKVYRQRILKRNPKPTSCPKGPGRALPVSSFIELYEFFYEVGARNMYFVEPHIVKPLTEPFQLSYAELVGPVQVQFFVSHFWGLDFRKTVQAMTHHAKSHSRRVVDLCGSLTINPKTLNPKP